VEPTAEFAHRQLRFTDPTQRRYEVIRPLLLFEDRMATQRAEETEIHSDTVRTFLRRFRQQGMLGLLPDRVEVSPRGRASRVPEAVRQDIARLKALYRGFHDRESVKRHHAPNGAHRDLGLRQQAPDAKLPGIRMGFL
jgi:hypothetical protein